MELDLLLARLKENSFRQFAENALLADPDALASRIQSLANLYTQEYGKDGDFSVYSVGGRTELCGNHTDHNHGLVAAATISADLIAVVSPRKDSIVRLHSIGHAEDYVDLSTYTEPQESHFFHSESLVAGMCNLFKKHGYKAGGFNAVTESQVPSGSGLSSSATFEVAVGTILNHLYNEGKISNETIAMIAQEAENQYFGKPCGLMDQMACAVGGTISIDFAVKGKPVVTSYPFSPDKYGYVMVLTATGGSHADLNDDYASVPAEMKKIAGHFGCSVLREVNEDTFYQSIAQLREQYDDRSIMRAIHFFEENARVKELKEILATDKDTMAGFTAILNASGQSSALSLQNLYTTKDLAHQPIPMALSLSKKWLKGIPSSTRVHGGGFAGAIQTFLPKDEATAYCQKMEAVFGKGACRILSIRPAGASRVL